MIKDEHIIVVPEQPYHFIQQYIATFFYIKILEFL